MDDRRIRQRDRGRRRVFELTRLVGVLAAAGALGLSVAAARSNPGKYSAPPAARAAAARAGVRSHRSPARSTESQSGTDDNSQSPPATTTPPVTTTSQPPVTVSGGS